MCEVEKPKPGFCSDDIQEPRHHVSRLAISALLETGMEPLSLQKQLEVALDIILTVAWLSIEYKGSIFLVDEDSGELVLTAQRNLPDQLLTECARIKPGYCLCGRAAQTRQIIYKSHMDADHDISFPGMRPHGHYCIPITSNEQLLGVLNIYIADGYEQNSDEMAFFSTISNTLAGLIERRLMERRLSEQNKHMQNLISHSLDMIISVDKSRKIVEFNPAAEKSLGYEHTEIVGQNIKLLFCDSNKADMVEVFTTTQNRFAQEVMFRRKNGETIPVFLSSAPIFIDDGSQAGAVCNARDISAEKKIQRLLRAKMESNKKQISAVAKNSADRKLIEEKQKQLADEIKAELPKATDSLRQEMEQIRSLVQDAILKLTDSFNGVREQSELQRQLVQGLLDKVNDDSGVIDKEAVATLCTQAATSSKVMEDKLDQAIMSLLFEDMVTQVTQSVDKKLAVMEQFSDGWSRDVLSTSQNIDSRMDKIRESLENQRKQFDEIFQKVEQTSMDEGEIDLF